MKLKAVDIMFFISLALTLFALLWLLKGSPTLETTVITIGLFIISSEMFLWRKVFEIDKSTAIGFSKVKNELDNLRSEMKNDLNNINNKLDKIENIVKK